MDDKDVKQKKWIQRGGYALAAVFLAIAVYFGISILNNSIGPSYSIIQTLRTAAENANDLVPLKNEIIDLNGLEYSILQKNEIPDVASTVIKGTDNYLYIPVSDETDAAVPAGHISILGGYLKVKDIPLLYISAPYKSGYRAKFLPVGVSDGTMATHEKFISQISKNGVSVMDLSDSDITYFRTDHHWTIESAFNTTGASIAKLKDLGFEIDPSSIVSDPGNYSSETLNNIFLGTIGRRVGALYAGNDNFTYITPNFNTDIYFEYRSAGSIIQTKEGDFSNALISPPVDTGQAPDYYSTYLNNGVNEIRVTNRLADNDKKLLIVGDSYGRPFGAFMSLYFAETRILDVQPGRFGDSIFDYIDSYKPDAVIVLFSDIELYNNDVYKFGVEPEKWDTLARLFTQQSNPQN